MTRRVYALDGTRGLAVFLVFFVHYHALFSCYLLPGSFSFSVSEFMEVIGHSGVDLFYVLSGYLIYGILIQSPPRYSIFLWRRAQRIYPTFLCVLALYLALSLLFPGRSKLPARWSETCVYVLENILLLPGVLSISPIVTVAWTLSYEFAFYLSMPLLIHLTGMRSWKGWQRISFFLTLILLFVCFSIAFFSGRHLRATMFGVGIILRELLNYKSIKDKLTWRGEIGAIILYLGSLGLIYWVSCHELFSIYVPKEVSLSWIGRVLLTAAGSFAFGLYSFGFGGILSKILAWRPIRKMGEISYSYYLIHGLALNGIALVLIKCLPPSGNSQVLFWLVAPCAFGMTLMSATVLFNLVEEPYSLRRTGSSGAPQPSQLPSLVAVAAVADGAPVQPSVN